jgi:aldehyde dehydrogenase (NAD+)
MLEKIVIKQKEYFNTNITKDINFRKTQLIKLKKSINYYMEEIYDALNKDLSKSKQEAYTTEISIVLSEINMALKNIDKWSNKSKKITPLHLLPSKSYSVFEPYGLVFILSPWNYPFQLSLVPLVGSIVAGNTAILEISKEAVYTKKIIKKILEELYDDKYIFIIDDSISYEEMLSQNYDYIFFTGSSRVAKIIMKAASVNLTPLTLELGGKNPCFIDETANIKICAKRIAWGKSLNCGQTCIAPDYILIDEKIKDLFVTELQKQLKLMFPDMINNPDYPKMINNKHFKRIEDLIFQQNDIIGGNTNFENNKIEMTIIDNCEFDNIVMEEEIFGPIIPIITYRSLNNILPVIQRKPRSLACYVFSDNQQYIDKILNTLSFGGGCINDVIMHIANENLPFGGVGNSGMGKYHGYYSFQTFSYEKSITISPIKIDLPLKYAPFKKKNLDLLYKLIK